MDKLAVLKERLVQYGKLCVCFSGGADSSFLLKVAKESLGGQVFPVIADGVMVPRRAIREAVDLAKEIGAACYTVNTDPLSVPEFRHNRKNRCYHCKKRIFTAIREKAVALGADAIADGKNRDDGNVYRPGAIAATELSVVSPLFEAGFTKAEIRAYSKELGLSTWDKPADACLATRLPTNTEVTADMLLKIESVENAFHNRNMGGTRARVHGNILRIETAPAHFSSILEDKELLACIKKHGFKYITLDLEGFRSGSMD